jgi:hypothetical protein
MYLCLKFAGGDDNGLDGVGSGGLVAGLTPVPAAGGGGGGGRGGGRLRHHHHHRLHHNHLHSILLKNHRNRIQNTK